MILLSNGLNGPPCGITLLEPAHGYLIMQKVEELSKGQVRMAAGTMYGTIENLLKKNLITSLPSNDSRRKIYKN